MNYKLQLSPMSSAPGSHSSQPPEKAWYAWPANSEETKVFRSWLVYDPEAPTLGSRVHFNWNLLLGLTVAAGISAAFWIAVGLTVARLWK